MIAVAWGLNIVPCFVSSLGRQDFFVFRYLPHISCTANAVITCIWRAICYLIKMGRFPKNKKLFLQLDGAGDNVNQTMLRFASWLCQEQICKTVRGAARSMDVDRSSQDS